MAIAGLLADGEPPRRPSRARTAGSTIAAGAVAMGAGEEGFAYDNERPRHEVLLPAFRIARRPVSNATWMHFSEGGGYERREWWSDEGWAWKEEYDITHHASVAAGDPEAPVCHVSWFEADAFARAHGARLPTEEEWERAATSEQRPAGDRRGLGVDRLQLPPVSRVPGIPLPGVLRGLLRRALPRAARRLLGHLLRGSRRPRSATGTCRSVARSSRACAWPTTEPADGVVPPMVARWRSRSRSTRTSTGRPSARSPTTCSTGSRARSRSCRRSTSTTRAAPSCSTASASCPSTTRRAPSARSSSARAEEIAELTGAVELVELGSGTAAKTRVLLDALHAAGTLRALRPGRRHREHGPRLRRELTSEYPGCACTA